MDDEQASRVPPPSLLHIAKSSRLALGAAGCCELTPVADAIGRFLHGARPQAWATPQMPRRLRK